MTHAHADVYQTSGRLIAGSEEICNIKHEYNIAEKFTCMHLMQEHHMGLEKDAAALCLLADAIFLIWLQGPTGI